MTNRAATNAVLPGLDREYFLRADKDGFPLQKQVPKSIQVYTGPGNTVVVPDGSDYLFINSTVAGGALTVDLRSSAVIRNMVGRKLTIGCTAAHVGAIVIDVTGNGRVFVSSVDAATGDQATIATTVPTVCTLHFVSESHILIEHGDAVTLA